MSAQRNRPSHTPTRSRLRGSGALPNYAPCAGRDALLRVRWRVRTTQQTIAHPNTLTAPRQRSPTKPSAVSNLLKLGERFSFGYRIPILNMPDQSFDKFGMLPGKVVGLRGIGQQVEKLGTFL